jgi:hypothetical protein
LPSEEVSVESSLKDTMGVVSPYCPSFYGSSVVVESEGAAVVVGLLNARYYEGSRGEFLSQDPVHWELGQTRDGLIAL